MRRVHEAYGAATPAFSCDPRNWLKAHPKSASIIEDKLDQLSVDATHPSLRTHKLHGHLQGTWACSGGYDVRIVFEHTQYEGAEAILLLALGTHDQVY